MSDPIRPSHYTSGRIECIESIEASMTPHGFKGFLKGNCIKYLHRYENKNGKEDLLKCQWYLEQLLTYLDREDIFRRSIEEAASIVLNAPVDPDAYMVQRHGPPERLS
jgi:hypothetical protein